MATLAQATSRSVEDLGLTRISPTHAAPSRPAVDEPSQMMFMRSPLPPISATPDSLRQFQVPGIPQMRIIPPQNSSNGVATNTGGTIIERGGGTSSSSGSATVITSQSIQNASVVTSTLSQGKSAQLAVPLSTVFALLRVSVNAPARVRLYSTKSAQTADVNRDVATPVILGSENGIIADLLLLANTELTWTCSPAILGFNDDDPRVSTCYVTITNPNPSSTVFTVSFTYAVLIA